MNKAFVDDKQLIAKLLKLPTIRQKARSIYDYVDSNLSENFSINHKKMEDTACYVIDVIRKNYPSLSIPYHSRWRHFEINGVPRIQNLLEKCSNLTDTKSGAILYELVIISVLLDAGAGTAWNYTEKETGLQYARSEGLAIASLDMYTKGLFSAHKQFPLRIDAQVLSSITEQQLKKGFQANATNVLEGIAGRRALLNRLGARVLKNTCFFGKENRLGYFFNYVLSLTENKSIAADRLFHAVIESFNAIWPVRLAINGTALGDVWTHSALKTNEPGSEYIPFHKLLQWLTYSLIEPLLLVGIEVTNINTLTGLPEYRNGGLFIDSGVLIIKDKTQLLKPHDPGSELIVEWRALTIILLDALAVIIRKKLGQTEISMPLTSIIQGGTWDAGRRIAKQKRRLGEPPLRIISDGTLF